MEKQYYTVKEFALLFSYAEITVRQKLAREEIKSIKIGNKRLIPTSEVERFKKGA